MKLIDFPVIGGILRNSILNTEAYEFWERHCKGFRSHYRDLLPGDVTRRTQEAIPQEMAKMLTRKRNRLLIKVTGWPRIAFLHKIFPDARFI